MGVLAPVCSWIPEDDLLLKNAVEAGASLESLAKGAVKFSRKFTIQELQNRWHALLYDPITSVEASAHMIKFDNSASSLPSKTNIFENSKERKCVSGKRQAESIRSCYYSMRKRIRNEPFDSVDLNFLVGPFHNNDFGNGDEPLPANYMLGDPNSNHIGIEDSNFDITQHSFPDFGTGSIAAANIGFTANVFYTEFRNPVVEDKQIPCTFEENIPRSTSCSGVEELGLPKEVLDSNMFEVHDLDAKPLVVFDQSIDTGGNVCSGFGGSQVFNSPISDCSALLHNFDYAPMPSIPIWQTIEDGVSAPIISDVYPSGNELVMGDAFSLLEKGTMENTNTLGYDVVHLNPKQKIQMPGDNTNILTPSPNDYLAELSNTLLNFTNEEEFLIMNADGKDGIEKTYIDDFSSLLSVSPNEDMPYIAANEATSIPEIFPITGGEHHRESDDKRQSHIGDGHAVSSSKSQMLSRASAVNPQFPELRNGAICCMLNTEDPEIPMNDDVFLPNRMQSDSFSSVTQLKWHDVDIRTSFVKGFSDHQKANAGCLCPMEREEKNPKQSHLSIQMRGSHLVPEMGPSHLVGDCGLNLEYLADDRPHLACKVVSTACEGPSNISAANVSTTPHPPLTLKDEATDIEQEKHLNNNADSYPDKPAPGFNNLVSYQQGNTISSKQEVGAPATIGNQQTLHAESNFAEMTTPKFFVNYSPADQEGLPSESEGDVPHFSDVEAMIHDMDLSPDDQDLYSCRDVSKYQHEDSKRAIIRLEQAAHSYMQRGIASLGALAVLYGRHSKFYIKKSEVLLGRATEEDFDVDIDLGREGRSNKISRRQAIINLDRSGSFYLKNLGKCSIFVNNEEIVPKQSVRLASSCLIEVRGMSFIFETNQNCVMQYLDRVSKRSPGPQSSNIPESK